MAWMVHSSLKSVSILLRIALTPMALTLLASKNVAIQDSTLATGDDCIAINGGCSNIKATRLVCQGGHGISIGSLGRNKSHETIEEVHVRNCTFIGTTNGARIKTWPEDAVKVSEVIYGGFKGTSLVPRQLT
ncbi:hypothetical protein ACSQ67_020751 [Phaseolus vulgaris]